MRTTEGTWRFFVVMVITVLCIGVVNMVYRYLDTCRAIASTGLEQKQLKSAAAKYVPVDYSDIAYYKQRTSGPEHEQLDSDIVYSSLQQVIRQRNALSRQLNHLRRTLGQNQCESSKSKTNDQGGWCRDASKENSGEHLTDTQLIPTLSQFLKNKTVASFGDGPGSYRREILKLQQVKSYDAFDGAPYSEESSNGTVKFMDLTIPQFGLPPYEWIISLEVAEHIPEKYEAVYLDNIYRHAIEGIILSWAVPGQGGLKHINNKPLEYVVKVMKNNGFKIDKVLSRKLQSSSKLSWIQRNINVYLRENYNTFRSKSSFLWSI